MIKFALFVLIATLSLTAAGQTPRQECFPFEKLSAAERVRAEEVLLKALDSEALYTIVGNLKPMSSGFASFQTPEREPRGMSGEEAAALVAKFSSHEGLHALKDDEKAKLRKAEEIVKRQKDLAEIEQMRKGLALWQCGEDSFFADVQHFAKTFDGKRYSEAVVFNKQTLRRMLNDRAGFFSRWAITPASHPLQVLYAIETDSSGARFGGYGYLFGYPDYAVNFFVSAAGEEEFTGKFVERSFYSVPTFSRPTNGFVWAVPKNHAENETDRAIKTAAAKIFTEYKTRRDQYIGPNKKGAVELIRDWFCQPNATCSQPF